MPGVGFPAHGMVRAAMKRHLAIVRENQTDSVLLLPKWHIQLMADVLHAQRTGYTSTRTGATSARNATCTT